VGDDGEGAPAVEFVAEGGHYGSGVIAVGNFARLYPIDNERSVGKVLQPGQPGIEAWAGPWRGQEPVKNSPSRRERRWR